MRQPVVAIVGRPNVGKSTLFNRLARRRISIVEDVPGVTRDRLYANATFDDVRYTIIDTGGFEPDPKTPLLAAVKEQTQLAIDEADAVVFVVDARAGPTLADVEVARMLRRSGRPLIVAANKVDSDKQEALAGAFYELGVDTVHPISATHGRGVEELMEDVLSRLPEPLLEAGRKAQRAFEEQAADGLTEEQLDEALDEAAAELDEEEEAAEAPAAGLQVHLPEVLRLAVIGRPNAGKSSLVNKLLGEERHLVSDIPGTTMDAVDSFLEHGGLRFWLIDTAGIRRKRSISLQMERYAVVSALKGIDRSDIALLLLDPLEGVTEQDLRIASFAREKGKGVILVVNKWDLARKEGIDADAVTQAIRDRMPFLSYAPIRFVSAKTGRKVFDLLDTAVFVAKRYFTRVPTGPLNRAIQAALDAHPPPVSKGRRVKIYFATQVGVAPPTFVLATNDPKGVHFSYERFLQNRLREAFDFEGTPLRLYFRQRGDEAGRRENIEARKRTRARKKTGPRGHGKRRKRA